VTKTGGKEEGGEREGGGEEHPFLYLTIDDQTAMLLPIEGIEGGEGRERGGGKGKNSRRFRNPLPKSGGGEKCHGI